MHSVDDVRSDASGVVVDEHALLDAQARLALAMAALDGAAEALIEAGLPLHEFAPVERSRSEVEVMQRILADRLDRLAATVRRSAAISDLVEHDRAAANATPAPASPTVTATDPPAVAAGRADEASAPDPAPRPAATEPTEPIEPATPSHIEIGGSATLEAVRCGGLYEGTEVLGRVVGLSATGVTFATAKPLRTADELRFHGRFFSEEVRAAVRVRSVDAESQSGGLLVSCVFEDIDAESRAAVDRILDHGRRAEAPISYSQLRLLTEPRAEPRRGMRRLLRR